MRISLDEIGVFAECPLMYKFIFQDKLPRRPNRDQEFSQKIHVLATWFFNNIQDGRIPGHRETRQKWGSLWFAGKTKYDIALDSSYKYEQRRNLRGLTMVDKFYEVFSADPGFVIANDFDFDVPIGNDHVLTGTFDLIREVDYQGNKLIQVIDWRTDPYIPRDLVRKRDIQLVTFDYAFRLMFQTKPDQLVYYSFKSGELYPVEPRPPREIQRLISSVNNICSIIENNLYYPRQDWQHNICRWCNYRTPCAHWR
jgi:hypothetical protein